MLSAHIEFLIVDLARRVVMISKCCIKLHTGIQEYLIRLLEFLLKVARRFAAVEVIAHHYHKVKGKFCTHGGQFLGDVVFAPVSSSVITDDGKLHRILLDGKAKVLGVNKHTREHTNESDNPIRLSHGTFTLWRFEECRR